MDIAGTGLQLKPFQTRGHPVVFVHYQSQDAAQRFLQMILNSSRGIGVFCGPESSGKKTIIRQLVRCTPKYDSVAIVDGTRLHAAELIETIVVQFGIRMSTNQVDERWKMLRGFLSHRTRAIQAPILVVDNVDKMHLSALSALCNLAELKVQSRYVLRMILTGTEAPSRIMDTPAMSAITARIVSTFSLGPMTSREAIRYLYSKLRAGGCAHPDKILPLDICDELHTASRGWPGVLDKLVIRTIERADAWPIQPEHIRPRPVKTALERSPAIPAVDSGDEPGLQKLLLTFNRKTLQEIDLKEAKILVGRSEICDVIINSRFVSKHHALLLRADNVMHLIDLNSTNGIFVNSRRVQSKVLRHEDIISIGNHGIKLICPAIRTRPATKEKNLADTARMKTLADLRRVRAQASKIIDPKKKQRS